MPISRLVASGPEELGVSPAALEALFAAGQREVTEGRAQGCQIAVARHGRLAAQRSFGVTEAGPVTDDTMFHIFSATKATMGVAICKLIEDGKLSLSDRVADLIPGFADSDGHRDDPFLKAEMTLKHVVTFTAGFPNPPGDQGLTLGTSEGRTKWACEFGLEWQPGEFYQCVVFAAPVLCRRARRYAAAIRLPAAAPPPAAPPPPPAPP
jgi:CubicO group peptidase (beta-lactamase class C family)